MFGTILIAIGTLMHIYVFWRAASVPFITRRVSRKALIGAGLILWAGFFLGRMLGHGGTGALATILELIGMSWLAALFLAFVCLLSIDLVTGFGFIFKRISPLLRGWALVAGAVLSLIAFVQGMRPPVVQDYEVRLAGLPQALDGTVIVGMSDLHLGSVLGPKWLKARVAQVQDLRPDMVVLLGDLFEGHGNPQEELISDLGGLRAPLGVWAVHGNHEFHGGNDKTLLLEDKTNIEVLRNRWTEVSSGLVLAGVDDLTNHRRNGQKTDPIGQALSGRPSGAVVLLSHTPWQVERAASAGVGLMLSGHTHGGQIWPFGYLVRRTYPRLEGRYEVDGMTLIVCRGTGTWGPRMRLWRPSEILRVTLRSDLAAS